MKKCLVILALLAGCGREGDQPAADEAMPAGAEGTSDVGRAKAAPEAANSLTGLYEGGPAGQRNQLCMVEKAGKTQFGLVVWGANMRNCSGAGTAKRDGGSLRLSMAGDETCEIEARMEGGRISLPSSAPSGCGYYCAPGTRFTGAVFTRSGSTAADAAKAKDLAGDPLC
jgi:hypothetical protein